MKTLSVLKRFLPGMVETSVSGQQNIPATGPVLLVGNHPNIIDGLLVAVNSPRPVRMVVAKELCTSPALKRVLDDLGWIAVERHEKGQDGDALQACVAALEAGEVLCIFPEGKTNYGGDMHDFKAGAALLALKTGAPVVPFAIRGTEELYPDGSAVFHRGRAALSFGQPMTFRHDVGATLATLRQQIARLQSPLHHIPVGRGLPVTLSNWAAAAVMKSLSLIMLTVRWSR